MARLRSLLSRPLARGAAALSAVALLAGCGVAGVRVGEGSGGPLGVGVQNEAGGETPTPTPTETQHTPPDGWTTNPLEFDDKCPGDMFKVALPQRWKMIYRWEFSPGESFKGDAWVRITCSDSYGDSASGVVENESKYRFTRDGSKILVDRRSATDTGAAWVYQAQVGAADIYANGQDSYAYGAIVVVRHNGKLFQFSYMGLARAVDKQGLDEIRQAMSYIYVNDKPLPTPTWKDI